MTIVVPPESPENEVFVLTPVTVMRKSESTAVPLLSFVTVLITVSVVSLVLVIVQVTVSPEPTT